jgi:hypothetical protein
VSWHGRGCVVTTGDAHSNIDPTDARKLIDEFQRKGFCRLCRSYWKNVTDNSTLVTSLSINGHVYEVSDYAGTAPSWVSQMDSEIDRVAGTDRWIGTAGLNQEQREDVCRHDVDMDIMQKSDLKK